MESMLFRIMDLQTGDLNNLAHSERRLVTGLATAALIA
jgi:hypothetical protein